MRSIGRVEAPLWLSDKSLKAAGARTSEPIEIFWGNPMPGTANGRGPGKWGCIMISLRLPVDAAGGSPLDRDRVCPQKTADVLGINLNCSESGRPERRWLVGSRKRRPSQRVAALPPGGARRAAGVRRAIGPMGIVFGAIPES